MLAVKGLPRWKTKPRPLRCILYTVKPKAQSNLSVCCILEVLSDLPPLSTPADIVYFGGNLIII